MKNKGTFNVSIAVLSIESLLLHCALAASNKRRPCGTAAGLIGLTVSSGKLQFGSLWGPKCFHLVSVYMLFTHRK